MRRATIVAAGLLASIPAFALAQAPGERIPNPQPVQGWNPTAPQGQSDTAWPAYFPPPAGIRTGNLTIYPAVTAGALFDDNVFATNGNRRSDWAAIVRPEIGFRGGDRNAAVEGGAFIEGRSYARYSSEDQFNGGATAAATVMPDPDTQLIGRLRYLHSHEDRGGGESALTSFDNPVSYNFFEASGALNRRFNRFWTSLGVGGSWQHYDTPAVAGLPISQSYRDGNIGVLSARFGYVVMPLTSLFVEGAVNRRNFDVDTFDSKGYRVVGGVLFEQGPGARVKGEAYAGYMYQDYSGATFQTVSTFTYGGALAWLVAPRWTAVFEGRRQALESALNPSGVLNGGTSVVESLLGARLDYSVTPRFIVGAGATYLIDEFKGAGRTDHTVSPLVSAKYLVTPNVTLGLDYRYVGFDSTGFGVLTYYRNLVLFSLNARI